MKKIIALITLALATSNCYKQVESRNLPHYEFKMNCSRTDYYFCQKEAERICYPQNWYIISIDGYDGRNQWRQTIQCTNDPQGDSCE